MSKRTYSACIMISLLLHVFAVAFLIDGAITAMQKPLDSSGVLLIGLCITIIANVIKGLNERNNRKEPPVS